ncbi:hypothetical protein BDF20DRAFT_916785 [Mycotypha africana]|uniref:uncharacterized protein n=1 Tax=Mycotypha africana TaxID=64632 RepID=UPI0023010938|nr:uncharacterized protein BDF20DRAFT_916785 [Mycotypha africana]KAI8968233.1 hypothetical protein BDF20DRAFT_916785 [Mycotypha africana]
MSEEVANNKTETVSTEQQKSQSGEDGLAKLTLFVRGIPYEATNQDLEDFFGEIGPVRKCFVVADRSASSATEFRNKGFGYVHYALEDDAKAAIEKLKDAKFMGKRKLKIDFAKRRSETQTHDNKEEEGSKKQQQKKKKKEKANKPEGPTEFDVNARLIVRNLPWKYRENDLKKLFEKYGKVHDVKLPRKFEGGPLRGFAFIQFETVEQGQAAMDALNATEHHGRTIAVDWSIPKTQYKEIEEKEATESAETAVKQEDVEMTDDIEKKEDVEVEMEEDEQHSDDDDVKDAEAEDVAMKMEEESDSEKSEEEANSDAMEEDEDENDENDESSSDESDDDSKDDTDKASVKANTDKEAKKKTLPTAADGTTLFVRNLLFESKEQDLKDLFKQWGPVIYAKITMDPVTKLSRGTGFVCMRNKEDVDTILKEAEELRALSQKDENSDKDAINDLLSKREKKKKGLVYKSLITAEPGSGNSAKFTLQGRVLDVTLAVDRQQAKELKDANATLKRKEDKRNLYLMREGVIFPNTPAAETLTPGELNKRQLSFSSRKKLVSNNPSLFISKTRLSIRNLPVKVDEKELKALGLSSISKFKNQVKAGERDDLSKEEKAEGWDRLPKVIQAKIVRSKDTVDSSGKLRSKGYGFLEFATHAHALAALRYLNNNPDIFNGKRLIVEFSLENKEVLDRRNAFKSEQRAAAATSSRGVKRKAPFKSSNTASTSTINSRDNDKKNNSFKKRRFVNRKN